MPRGLHRSPGPQHLPPSCPSCRGPASQPGLPVWPHAPHRAPEASGRQSSALLPVPPAAAAGCLLDTGAWPAALGFACRQPRAAGGCCTRR